MPYKDKKVDREYKRKYYRGRGKADPEYFRRNNHAWRSNHPEAYMISRVRSRARKEGLPFNLEPADIHIPEYCPVFPELKLEFSVGRGIRPDNIPTLDRVIPALGYVKGNVAVISMRANRLKSDASAEELQRIVDWIKDVTKNSGSKSD